MRNFYRTLATPFADSQLALSQTSAHDVSTVPYRMSFMDPIPEEKRQ